MRLVILAACFLICTHSAPGDELDSLAPPVQIPAAGRPLDVQREGHSAPFLDDFDGDGVVDLLVGQYDDGRLRIYRNLGSNAAPKFADYTWFKAGDADGRVPFG